MIDRLKAHISRGFDLERTSPQKQLAQFRRAIGLAGQRVSISRADRFAHKHMIERANEQMHREQIVGHDASHTATKKAT